MYEEIGVNNFDDRDEVRVYFWSSFLPEATGENVAEALRNLAEEAEESEYL